MSVTIEHLSFSSPSIASRAISIVAVPRVASTLILHIE